MTKRNKHIGSSLHEFLKEEGVLAETVPSPLRMQSPGRFSGPWRRKTSPRSKWPRVWIRILVRSARWALFRLVAQSLSRKAYCRAWETGRLRALEQHACGAQNSIPPL